MNKYLPPRFNTVAPAAAEATLAPEPAEGSRVEALFAEAMEREPALRTAFVRSAAGGDAELEREVHWHR